MPTILVWLASFIIGTMTASILLVDDEPTITSALEYHFSHAGYETFVAHSGREAIESLKLMPNLVVLDVMLPDMNGHQICQYIRSLPMYLPVLMLTAKDSLEDKISGLDIGADAYLAKPYNPQELLAQARALLRLSQKDQEAILTCGVLELHLDSNRLMRDGVEIALTTTEFELLSLLMQNSGQVFGRETLLRTVWGYGVVDVTSRTVDTHIQRLRAKIEPDPKTPQTLVTVRGFGYRLICTEA